MLLALFAEVVYAWIIQKWESKIYCDGVQGGSHAIYAISSVKNEELVCGGPNPFADVRTEWSPAWLDPVQPVLLLPPDAELDPIAVARLTLGVESPRHSLVSGNDEAPQCSSTSSAEAPSPHVQPALPGRHPWSPVA